MEFNIADFLTKLETEAEILPQIRKMVATEIDKYAGMRQVLESTESNKEFTNNLLTSIDNYLEDLSIIQKKLNFTFLTLLKEKPDENPLINEKLIQILRKLNSKQGQKN